MQYSSLSIQLLKNENSFIEALLKKEKWAQKMVYEECYQEMLLVCLRYANNKDHAIDIMHDGFIKVFKNIEKYKSGTSFNHWVKRIMINTSIDQYRKDVRRRTENIADAYDLKAKQITAIEQLSEKEILSGIQKLSPVYKIVFNLYVIEGYSHKEIAERIGINESTSRSNLVKARAKLKEILGYGN
ncbi:MAG: sigma-70 family RNA polymerase sigma factor [Saprospirales bacterium]|nr:MAG: sigma-70 family RNA polymerase sigma factor [Saprospirales bacterium]